MKKIHEVQDFTLIGHYQCILESQGIDTLVKNQTISSFAGELPANSIYPELWVTKDEDYDKAIQILTPIQQSEGEYEDYDAWVWEECNETVEGQYAECWNCGVPSVAYK